jgi:hypothetical protein
VRLPVPPPRRKLKRPYRNNNLRGLLLSIRLCILALLWLRPFSQLLTSTYPSGLTLTRWIARADSVVMLWCYSTGSAVFQIDAKFDRATNEFVLRFYGGRHHDHVERFKDAIALRKRLDALEQELAAQRRERGGSPALSKDGQIVP